MIVSRGPAPVWPYRAALVVALVGLTAAALLGRQVNPADAVPAGGPEAVVRLPAAVAALLVASAVVCAGVAWVLLRRAVPVRLPQSAAWAWWVAVLLGTTAVLLDSRALVIGSLAGPDPVIPVFHWLFVLVPTTLAGLVMVLRGPFGAASACVAAGVAVLPPFALGWALTTPPAGALDLTVFLGGVPLLLALAISTTCGMPGHRSPDPARGPAGDLSRG